MGGLILIQRFAFVLLRVSGKVLHHGGNISWHKAAGLMEGRETYRESGREECLGFQHSHQGHTVMILSLCCQTVPK